MLEISGGNYSSPVFATFDGFTSDSTSSTSVTRQSLFAHFTRTLLPDLPAPPGGPAIMLTGGLHSRHLIADAVRTRSCDLAGIGRPACVIPDLPDRVVLHREIPEEEAVLGGYKIPGGETMKYLLGGGRSTKSKAKAKDTSKSKCRPSSRSIFHRPNSRPEPDSMSGPANTQQAQHGPPPASYLDDEDTSIVPSHPPQPEQSESESTPLLQHATRDATQGIPLVGAGISTFWHEWQCSRLGRGVEPDMRMHWFWGGLLREAVWWGMLGGGPRGWWASWRG